MNAAELTDLIVRSSGNSQTKVRFLYGQSELHVVQAISNAHDNELVVSLDELRDLSDTEKHEG